MIQIGQEDLQLEDFEQLIFEHEKVELSNESKIICDKNHKFLCEFSENKIIYGINTGFGPMAQFKVEKEDQTQLQKNLILAHCVGSGNLISDILVRAILICRLNTLAIGFSGVHHSVFECLIHLINQKIYPQIFEHGSVGASGDLVQLAHIGSVLIGLGKVSYNEKILETTEVFNKLGIKPIKIRAREGLAIINGTSAMTGIGLVNIIYSRKLCALSIMISCLINECVRSFDDHFASSLNERKKHFGQNAVATIMRNTLSGSKLIRKREDIYYNCIPSENIFDEKVQEYYSLRCVPQIVGPIFDTIQNAKQVLVDELNSVSDNPIISHEEEYVFHGGNFHGDYISLEMDKLRLAITRLSMLSERQLNFLLNDQLNNILPPFLNEAKLGFNFGLQGAQFTATSTTAENQTLSTSVYIHSISCNNDNQDIVSMGTNAAQLTKKVIDNTFEIMSIQVIGLVKAIRILNIENDLSPKTKYFLELIKKQFDSSKEDQILSETIREGATILKNMKIVISL